MLVLLGVRRDDGPEQADRLARKLRALRIFNDSDGKLNLDVGQAGGEILCVSQFTLYGDARKGNRPSFVEAAPAGGGRGSLRARAGGARREGRRVRRAHGDLACA